MKKQILGFASIAQFVNNAPGSISQVGELSTWSATYSKTKGEYSDPTISGYHLTTFSVVDAATGFDTTLADPEASLAIRITKEAVIYATTNPLPLDPNDFRNSIQAAFFNEIQNLTIGELIQGPSVSLPSWFDYEQKTGDKNIAHIWLADSNFQAEYPENDITIIPPYPDLSIFEGNWQNAVNKLPEWNTFKLMDEVQVQKNKNPETYIRYYEFDFVNRANPTQKVPTSWYALIYGESGDNDDAVKDAIIDKLVTETGRDEAFWETVFPELFKRTEFVCYPRWDRLSIPNVSDLTALYSPFTDLDESNAYIRQHTPFYPAPHFNGNIFTFPVTYKSIMINGVNGVNNADDQRTIWGVWPDYIAVGTSEPDFQRMMPKTQDWVHFMIRLISNAETATSTSTLPQGMRRVTRGDLMYLSGNHNKANYMACMRRNFVTG